MLDVRVLYFKTQFLLCTLFQPYAYDLMYVRECCSKVLRNLWLFRKNKHKLSLNYYSCSVRSINNVWKEFNRGNKRNEMESFCYCVIFGGFTLKVPLFITFLPHKWIHMSWQLCIFGLVFVNANVLITSPLENIRCCMFIWIVARPHFYFE